MKTLETHIRNAVSIPENALQDILRFFQSTSLQKNEHIVRSGEYCENYYYVQAGSLRIYAEINHIEITSWFAFEGYFFTELESYTYQSKSRFNIQAIEPCTILYIPRSNMTVLLEKYPAWSEMLRKTWEQAFIRLSQVVLSFHNLKVNHNAATTTTPVIPIQKDTPSTGLPEASVFPLHKK